MVNNASICSGQSATLTASGADSYSWSEGSTANPLVISPVSKSSYTVTGTTSGCTGTSSPAVSTVTVALLINDTRISKKGNVTLIR